VQRVGETVVWMEDIKADLMVYGMEINRVERMV